MMNEEKRDTIETPALDMQDDSDLSVIQRDSQSLARIASALEAIADSSDRLARIAQHACYTAATYQTPDGKPQSLSIGMLLASHVQQIAERFANGGQRIVRPRGG